MGKDSVVVPDAAAGGSGGGIDMGNGSGGSGGVDSGSGGAVGDAGHDAPADQSITPDAPIDFGGGSSVDGAMVDGGGVFVCSTPVHAWDYPVPELYTVSWDQDGSLITGAEFYPYPISLTKTPSIVPFAGTTITNAGSTDVVVAKLDPGTGNAKWAFTAGDGADQAVSGTAVTSGNVVAAGVFDGTLDIDPVNQVIPAIINSGAQVVAYVMGLNDGDGTGVWSKKVDLGTSGGSFTAIAGNPTQAYFLVCGAAMKKPTTLNPTGTLGGGLDVIVAAIKASDGTVMWAKLFGGAMNQSCAAAALDDSGNAYFAGSYAGTLDFGLGALTPAPTGSQDQIAWVAKLNGADGTTLAAQAFGTSGQVLPAALALDPQGNAILGGSFQTAVLFGSQTLTPTPVGTQSNGFVVKLDGATLAPSWSRGFGGSKNGNSVNGVAVDSTGKIMVVGGYEDSMDTGSGGGVLQSNLNAGASDAPVVFALTLDGASGQTLCARSYGDPNSGGAGAVSIAINRTGTGANKDRAAVGGFYNGVINFGGESTALSAIVASPQHDGFLLEL